MDANTPENLTNSAKSLTDTMSTKAVEAIGATQAAVDGSLDKAKRALETSAGYLKVAHEELEKTTEKTVKYVAENPGHALLIAAGVGALIVLIASLCSSSDSKSSSCRW